MALSLRHRNWGIQMLLVPLQGVLSSSARTTQSMFYVFCDWCALFSPFFSTSALLLPNLPPSPSLLAHSFSVDAALPQPLVPQTQHRVGTHTHTQSTARITHSHKRCSRTLRCNTHRTEAV